MSLRVIITAQSQFRFAYQRYGNLNELGDSGYLKQPDLIRGEKAGYLFQVTPVDKGQWQWYAECRPKEYNETGIHSFYVDERGVIKSNDTGTSEFMSRETAEQWVTLGE